MKISIPDNEPNVDEYEDDHPEDDSLEMDCPGCSGTGKQYEGDLIVGDCNLCGGSGISDE